MGPQVVPVPTDRRRQAAEALIQAFMPSPVWTVAIPDESRRLRTLTRFYTWSVRFSALEGLVAETTPTATAVAMWAPPESSTQQLDRFRPLLGALRVALAMTREEADRFFGYLLGMDQRRHQLLPEPHWSLEVLGVLPQWQRFGLGAVLVRHGIRRADSDRVPVYIETDSDSNHRFYAKLGLELVEYVEDYPPMNLPTWRLIHKPPA